MKSVPHDSRDRDILLVTQLACAVSIFSFMIYLRRADLLLYGDAVAHINIARRVFDSKTPGLLQLGTVWLPLPHLLMVPFVISKTLWQSGIGGSIPSLVAYVLSVIGIFRLVRGALSFHSPADAAVRAAAWGAALIYGANPNLLYLQSTAMTEPLYLAFFIWAVVWFLEFVQQESRIQSVPVRSSSPLMKCGWILLAACLTRYDGWFLAAIMFAAAFVLVKRSTRGRSELRRNFGKFFLLAISAPILWLSYNAIVYRNPLEFANGPYSAKAIEQKTATPGNPSHPGDNNLPVAFSFFLKSTELNVASATAIQRLWIVLIVIGSAMTLLLDLRLWPLLFLWLPLPFYMLSIAYSGVPIFLPVWWPHSYYNLRYGLQLLPAFAVFMALFAHFAIGMASDKRIKIAIGLAIVFIVGGSYAFVWHEQPVCFREAWINSRDRLSLEKELAETLRKLPRNSTLLMYVGHHVGALQDAGVSLDRVINEGNHRPWKKPSDPQGLWERALADPRQYADYVIAGAGDETAMRVEKTDLSPLVVLHAGGEPETTIYWTHRGER